MTEPSVQTRSVEESLRARILHEGQISFYEWMKAALYDERGGYYCRTDRVAQGRTGDYRTAPETSPLFATTFAHYFSQLFADLKSPSTWTIFEAGAGGGEFAFGVLSSLRTHAPQIFDVTSYVIDEVSSAARVRATERLAEFGDRVSFRSFTDIGNAVDAGIVFSNELIDALPVNRVVMRSGKLRQLYVALKGLEFVWVEGELEKDVAEYCDRIGLKLAEGHIFEVNIGAEQFISTGGKLIKRGFLITVDYGAERDQLLGPDRKEGTLRAFHRHQIIDNVLARPGHHDLTTTVDWTQLKDAGEAAGLCTVLIQRLDQFLLANDVLEHLSKATVAAPNQSEALRLSTGVRELILPTGLAASFQVLVQAKH